MEPACRRRRAYKQCTWGHFLVLSRGLTAEHPIDVWFKNNSMYPDCILNVLCLLRRYDTRRRFGFGSSRNHATRSTESPKHQFDLFHSLTIV
jgi:hypothetical protein